MSRYQDTFAALAERGDAAGATAVLDRVRHQLEESQTIISPPRARRRLTGPVLTAAVFAAVLAVVGAGWALRIAGDHAGDATGTTWVTAGTTAANERFFAIAGGSGGFVADTLLPVVRFSADGVTWEDVDLSETTGAWTPERLLSGTDGWALVGVDIDNRAMILTSPDGREWTRGAFPDALSRSLASVALGTGSYLAWTAAPFADSTAELWWSADAATWQRVDLAVFADGPPDNIVGHDNGYVAWNGDLAPAGAAPYPIYTSGDGATWRETQLEIDPDLAAVVTSWEPTLAQTVGDQWIVLGVGHGPGIEPTTLVWTSADGASWQAQPTPPFDVEDGLANHAGRLLPAGENLIAIVSDAELVEGEDRVRTAYWDEGSAQAWATSDGVTWIAGQRFEPSVSRAAVAVVAGNAIGWWEPGGRPQFASVPVTTVTIPPESDLDPAGIALQDEILADGEVTRAEFESAVAAMAQCLTDHGLEDVHWSVDDDGGFSLGHRSEDDAAESLIDNYCEASYVDRLSAALR
jgi:hypothetical protein